MTEFIAHAAPDHDARRNGHDPDDDFAQTSMEPEPPAPAPPPLASPHLYLNRELSWLAFNERVLGEAKDASHPLLERVKFLAIAHSNLDEFYMVRVSGFQEQVSSGMTDVSPDGMTTAQQLALIRGQAAPMLADAATLFQDTLRPEMDAAGINLLEYSQLTRAQRKTLRDFFQREVFPVLTPLALGPGHPFPHISNLSLNLAVVVRDPQVGEKFARMKVPGVLPRLVLVPPPRPKTPPLTSSGSNRSSPRI